MLLTVAFLCFAVQVVAWVVLPRRPCCLGDEKAELAGEAIVHNLWA